MAAMHSSSASSGESSLARNASTRPQASPNQGVLMRGQYSLAADAPPASLPPVKTAELTTPALVVDAEGLEANLRPWRRPFPATVCALTSRPTSARRGGPAGRLGHTGFTCATVREMEGMAGAGLGDDLLLANEVADASRLGELCAPGHV